MLHFYTSFRILFQESTASIQYFLKLTLSRSKTVSIEAFYSKACCTFLKECPTVFKECITLCNGTLQKSTALLYYNFFWIHYRVQWILHSNRLRELSYWVSLCCWHFQRNTAPSGKVLLHLLKHASCYYICLRIQHSSKKCCVHSKSFFQGKTCSSTTACILLNEIVQPSQECPTMFCNMSETLSNILHHTASNERLSLQVRLFQSPAA